jgi:hypothetical protein
MRVRIMRIAIALGTLGALWAAAAGPFKDT